MKLLLYGQVDSGLLGTTLAEDQALLKSAKPAKGLSGPDRLAVAFRIEKKKVLHSCLKALTS
eukprot:scaffold14160_cov15-Tisochrysis_lutea.AAC.1